MQAFRRICAVVVGLVFALSAVLKLMDPVGTGLIVEGYCQFLHLDFLKPASKVIGEILSLVEATLSIALITGVWQKISAIATFAMLGFFTLISIILVIFNPEMTCGCFGKAIELTHLQTLIKNIILLCLSSAAFLPMRKLGTIKADRYVSFSIAEAAVLAFAVYSLLTIPVLDFTEFAESHSIVDESARIPLKSEYPVLPVWDANGHYCPEVVLDGRVVAVSVYAPEELDPSDRNRIASFVQDALNSGWTPVVLVAGSMEIPGADVYMADYKKLLTLNRSNGGAVFLDDGYIIRKYAGCDYPGFEQMEEMYESDAVEMYLNYTTKRSLILQAISLAVLAVMFFV